MKKVSLAFIFIFPMTLLSSPVDFGVKGQQYDIVEENANNLIHRKIKELNVTKIQNGLNSQVKEIIVGNQKIKQSQIDSKNTKKDLVAARWDIRDIDGSILYHKGDMITSSIPDGAKLELCFVDGSLAKNVVDYIVKDFGKKCVYMVNKFNAFDFGKIYGVESYPMGGYNEEYTKRFNVKRIPTKITKEKDVITTQTLSIKRISLEVLR